MSAPSYSVADLERFVSSRATARQYLEATKLGIISVVIENALLDLTKYDRPDRAIASLAECRKIFFWPNEPPSERPAS